MQKAISASSELPTWSIGLAIVIMVSVVIFEGVKVISRVCEKLVPFMAVPNIIVVLLLSGLIARETRHYVWEKNLDEKDDTPHSHGEHEVGQAGAGERFGGALSQVSLSPRPGALRPGGAPSSHRLGVLHPRFAPARGRPCSALRPLRPGPAFRFGLCHLGHQLECDGVLVDKRSGVAEKHVSGHGRA